MPRCPECKKLLKAHKHRDVPMHRCRACDGHWLSELQLSRVLNTARDTTPADAQVELLASAKLNDSPRTRYCFNCGCGMARRRPRDLDSVTVDVCPRCGGVWLQRGELAALEIAACRRRAEQAAKDPTSAAARKMVLMEELATRRAERKDLKAEIEAGPTVMDQAIDGDLGHRSFFVRMLARLAWVYRGRESEGAATGKAREAPRKQL